jgi:N-acetylmuramoyl-L-alanine amidase
MLKVAGMRRTAGGIAATAGLATMALALAVPAQARPTTTVPARGAAARPQAASLAPAVGAVAGTPASVVPVPSTWEGGKPVLVAPRWWPRGTRYASAPWSPAWPKPVRFVPTRHGVLSGLVIALDPGHDLGNGRHTKAVNTKYWVGLWKTCNTTGTATDAGYPEATYTFDVVARLRRLLVANGATVVVTRDRDSAATYGPCIGARGAFGAQEHARFMVQVHADGASSRGHGFHAIVPARLAGYTDDIYRASKVLGQAMIAGMKSRGFVPATYLSTPLQVRSDTGAQNSSDVPIVTVETLNMRNAGDARVAMSTTGRQHVAQGLYAGIVRYYLGS